MKRKSALSYDQRYRHKLNMLEPGIHMLRGCMLLAVAGGVCLRLGRRVGGVVLLMLAGLLFLILTVLIGIELHQDRVLNELAAQENQSREEY